MKIVKPSATLLWMTASPLTAIELAGRTCYKSEDKITPDSAAKFCQMLISNGHDAMLEHASASVRVVCDRGVSHEIVRHRIASYAQESTRYCNYSKEKFGGEITVIEPPFRTPAAKINWEASMRGVEQLYLKMIEWGEYAQIARSILPNCLKTEIVITMNFREWRHFFKLRLVNKKAHPQMREVAALCLEAISGEIGSVRSGSHVLFEEFNEAWREVKGLNEPKV